MPQLLVSDKKGRIFNIEYLEPTGMKAGHFFRLPPEELIKLPEASCLFFMPQRFPIAYDVTLKRFVTLKGGYFAVSAFLAPGFTATYNVAYEEHGSTRMLPLFSYAAVAFYKDAYYTAAVKVDTDRRHDPRFIDMNKVKENVLGFRKIFAHNRLVRHLEECALSHYCPNAQNFFLSRYEAPLPVSPLCNASCAGCISYQPGGKCPATQPRIKFVPTPEEISEIALYHLNKVNDPIVSFGQGCEGEPLLAGEVVERAIRLIRKRSNRGIININTNASLPEIIARLFDAGLDTMRVSLNSVRKLYYNRYYRPKGYVFSDVIDSIRMAKRRNKFVSINYLTMPGFTDSAEEVRALKDFIARYRINMIQWRNLNYDPLFYFRVMRTSVSLQDIIGIKQIMITLKKDFPQLIMGYFNPNFHRAFLKNKEDICRQLKRSPFRN